MTNPIATERLDSGHSRRSAGAGWVALLSLLLLSAPTAAQRHPTAGWVPRDSVTVEASSAYAAGPLRSWLLGTEYRTAWSAPVPVAVLDLARFAGGLNPVKRGGGVQTATLRFEAADGREYNFRSVDKTYAHSVPEWARGTLLEWLRQDQTSAQHPGAALVATPLLEAAGILTPGPRLVVMPDDGRLGEFRAEFAGLLGTVELHPNEGEDDEPLFAGSRTIAGGDRVLEHLDEEPEHRVDGAAFLAERLMSVYVNDWDRHIDQYRFARYERDGVYRWVPIPEDRDYAFVHHDGLLLTLARAALTARLIRFGPRYPDLLSMLSNSEDLARRLLSDVERATWDSVATAVHSALTDRVILDAVAAQPEAWRERTGDRMADALRARTETFLGMSDRFYRLIAAYPEIYGTDSDEIASIEHHADGSITVAISAPGSAAWGDRPYYRRTFHPDETRELRLYLGGGNDRAVVRGKGRMPVRVVGEAGDDLLADSSGAPVFFYDAEGRNRFIQAARTEVDRRRYEPPEETFALVPNSPRDFGSKWNWFTPAAHWEPDAGLLIGGGPRRTVFGFRHHPHEARHGLSLLMSPTAWRGSLTYHGDLRREGSPDRLLLATSASNVDLVRFHGWGNASPAAPADSTVSWLRRVAASADWVRPAVGPATLQVGAIARYSDPVLEPGSPLSQIRPHGAAAVTELGLRVALDMDTRDRPAFPRHGLAATVALGGMAVPGSAPAGSYLHTRARFTGYGSLPGPVPVIAAVRLGGVHVAGNPPIFAAARLGGREDLRGFSEDRFTGDAAAHGTLALRVPLFPANIVARGTIGVSGFVDTGRVWVDGESPGGWHTGTGAGLWFTTPLATLGLEWARGEKESFYLRLGLGL